MKILKKLKKLKFPFIGYGKCFNNPFEGKKIKKIQN
jgi:hypothetical protein